MAYATISKPGLHFNTKLYTGTGSSNAQTGVGFQPDFTWIKSRSATYNHGLYDVVRGVTKRIVSNNNNAEDTRADALTAFGTDGFTLGTDNQVNANSATYASWNWKAGGAGSANTAGTINSTVSVNTTAGFSIVKWTGNGVAGASIGHGLGVVPKLIIVKRLNDTANWTVYHASLGNTHRVELNDTGASTSDAGAWNNQTPTTTLFYTGNNLTVGNNGSNYIAYCFHSVKGFSKIGTYTGNQNDDGPFIYTGFKPAWVMLKNSSDSQDWQINDNRRPGYNYNHYLIANTSNAEVTSDNWVDFTSNGFKLRKGQTQSNRSDDTYIYMAFAEEPLVANVGASIPATAR
jgi:hypothetical protein